MSNSCLEGKTGCLGVGSVPQELDRSVLWLLSGLSPGKSHRVCAACKTSNNNKKNIDTVCVENGL